MTSQVIEPTAEASPAWVQHLVNAGATIWSNHPIAVPASALWIQLGLGIWLIAAPRGYWSRLAGVAGASWGIPGWSLGESFGGIFAPGLSWVFGAPGAVVFSSLAGVFVALSDRAWSTERLGPALLGGWACSSWAWPCCRPGPDVASGKVTSPTARHRGIRSKPACRR